jgi:hypothetical protein
MNTGIVDPPPTETVVKDPRAPCEKLMGVIDPESAPVTATGIAADLGGILESVTVINVVPLVTPRTTNRLVTIVGAVLFVKVTPSALTWASVGPTDTTE